jgi:hypothetical protein
VAHRGIDAPAAEAAEIVAPAPTGEIGEIGEQPLGQQFRFSSIWRRAPRLVAIAILLNAAILVLSIFAWPANRSPDELVHVDLVAAVARGTAVPWPAPAQLHQTLGDKASAVKAAGCRCEPLRAQDAPAAWPSWNDAGGDTRTVHINWMVQHPPLYYGFMAAALKAFPNWRNHPYNVVLAYLKLVNLVFILPLPLLAWAAARRLTGNRVIGATAAVGALLVPHVQHVGSSINNDNLLIFEGALLAVLLAHVIRGDTSKRTGIFVALTVAAALLTKGTALVFLPWVLITYVIAWRRSGAWSRAAFWRTFWPAAIALAGATALGGWWWIHNKIAYGVVQVNGDVVDQHEIARRPGVTTFGQTGVDFVVKFFKNMVMTLWLDTTQRPVPLDIAWVSVVLTAAAGLIVLIGMIRPFVSRPGRADTKADTGAGLELRRIDVLWLLTVPVLILGILLNGAWPTWRIALASTGQQGRYLYPGLVALLILFAVGLRTLAGRRAVLVTAIAVGITQLMMGIALVWSYWLPRGRPVSFGLFADAWHTMVVWSAVNSPVLGGLVVLVVALFAVLVWEAARFQGVDVDPRSAASVPDSPTQALPVGVSS